VYLLQIAQQIIWNPKTYNLDFWGFAARKELVFSKQFFIHGSPIGRFFGVFLFRLLMCAAH